jgi:hypothetical protein
MKLLLQYKKCLPHLGNTTIIALFLLENYPGYQGMYPIAPCLFGCMLSSMNLFLSSPKLF